MVAPQQDDDAMRRALVVAAHPDDVDFGAAGTVARWVADGVAVTYAIITNGDSGGFDASVARTDIPRIRQEEQRAAAHAVGVTDVVFLGYPDGSLEVSMKLRRDITRLIRRVRPGRVLCHSPERNWKNVYASHPDHLAAGAAALAAVYPDARNPFAHPELAEEGLEAHIVSEVWMLGGPQPDHHVDVTDVFDRKLAALACHVSQMQDPAGGAPARVEEWMRSNADQAGLPAGRLAEAFQVIDTR